MRIALYSGSTLYPLAGQQGVTEHDHSSAAGFTIAPQVNQQVAAYVRGTHSKPIDRGNLLNIMTFSTTRKFASVLAAQGWALDYDADFARSGTLYLDALDTTGIITRRTMANAVVDPPVRRCIGATVLLDYTVRGGVIADGEAYPDIEVTGTLTSDGSTPASFGTLQFAAGDAGKPVYTNNGLTTGYSEILYWNPLLLKWMLSDAWPTGPVWTSTSDTHTPDLATGWTPTAPATGTPVVALA